MRDCCVITNKAGSAAFKQDVSIPEEYKFEDVNNCAEDIINLIEDIYLDFERHKIEFNNYRELIADEEENLKRMFYIYLGNWLDN